MTEQQTLYKLIVLYMLSKIDFSMTYSQISDFVLGRGYTDGFTLQAAITDLEDDELIHAETLQNIRYFTITPEGESTIGYFVNMVSPAIREDIVSYLKEHRLQLRNETSVLSDYYRSTSGEYEVRCRVREKNTDLIELKLSVPDEQQAKAISLQWKRKCQDIYAYVMKELMV